MDIEFIRQKFQERAYVIDSQHVLLLDKHGITPADMERAILAGEIIEVYPHNLILGFLSDGTPLHIACSYWAAAGLIYVHNVYVPDERWEPNYRTRRRDRRMR